LEDSWEEQKFIIRVGVFGRAQKYF
jgi:hypothetical protein